MTQQCVIYESDFTLYLSVLLVLILIFPMIDLIIIRITWFYKDDLLLPVETHKKVRPVSPHNKDNSFFSRSRSFSSQSTRSFPVHPLARTQATLVFSNSESRLTDESVDTQRRLEDTIIYGKSSARSLSIRNAMIETTSQFRQSIESDSIHTDTEKSPVVKGHTPVRVESLPGIDTPVKEMSVKKRGQKRTKMGEVQGETFRNLHTETILPEITRVTPVMKHPAIQLAMRSVHQSTESIERLADTSVLYQDKYEVVYSHSQSELNETTSCESTPVMRDKKLLIRPDNSRRKPSKLDSSLP